MSPTIRIGGARGVMAYGRFPRKKPAPPPEPTPPSFLSAASNSTPYGSGGPDSYNISAQLTAAQGDFLFAQFLSRNLPVPPVGWTQLGQTLDPGADGNGLIIHSLWFRISDLDGARNYTLQQQNLGGARYGFLALGISVWSGVDTSGLAVAGLGLSQQPADPSVARAPGLQTVPAKSRVLRLWGARIPGTGGGQIQPSPGTTPRYVQPSAGGATTQQAITLADEEVSETGAVPAADGTMTGTPWSRNAFTAVLPGIALQRAIPKRCT